MDDVVRLPAQRIDRRSFVCSRQLQKKMQISMTDATAKVARPKCIDFVAEGAQSVESLHFGAGRAAIWVGSRVGHHQDSQAHTSRSSIPAP